MKSKELKDLKSKKREELTKMVIEKKKELVNIVGRIHVGREKNLKKGRNLKKDIAQILTIMKGIES